MLEFSLATYLILRTSPPPMKALAINVPQRSWLESLWLGCG
ncbi:MAG: hypothetical protein AAB401_19325 [Acidobacteriota bacterium]